MTAAELLVEMQGSPEHYQLFVNDFIDAFRRASDEVRGAMVSAGPERSGRLEGLTAAVVSALTREVGLPAPRWVESVGSPEPFFIPDAKGYALRVRLMLESPSPFRVRNIFVPANYLARA